MNRPDPSRVMSAFEAVADLPAGERAAALDEACGDDAALRRAVERMLEADDTPPDWLQDGAIDARAVERAEAASEARTVDEPTSRPGASAIELEVFDAAGARPAAEFADRVAASMPERIGPFRVRRRLGAGGMGVVYEAEQDHPRRTVALKIVRAAAGSSEAARRFEIEVQSLARLRHPGIAALHQVGVQEGAGGAEPWIAMEFVPGARSITEYADECELGRDARLVLLASICDAVHHGHLRGVIHRDLKPDNLLVDERGQPKVIDFGVARSADISDVTARDRTRTGQWVGTPRYMSPEQCSGRNRDVDVRTDTWALGVIAYELLTGSTPHGESDSVVTMVRRITEDDPPAPHRFDRSLRGDVDAVLLRALEKNPDRRYQSASELGEEFRRIVEGRPVDALRHRRSYLVRRWAWRHRRGLVSGIVAASLVAIIGIAASSAMTERSQRRHLQSLFGLLDQREQIRDQFDPLRAAPEEVMTWERALDRLDPDGTEAADLDLADLRLLLAELWLIVADHDRAYEAAMAALRLRELDRDGDPADLAQARHTLGQAEFWRGSYADAAHHYETAIANWESARGEHRSSLALSLDHLGEVYRRLARYEASGRCFDRAIEIRRASEAPTSLYIVASLNNRALLRRDLGRVEEAEAEFAEAFGRLEAHIETVAGDAQERGRLEAYAVRSLRSLASCAMMRGDFAAARDSIRRAIDRTGDAPAGVMAAERRRCRLLSSQCHLIAGDFAAALEEADALRQDLVAEAGGALPSADPGGPLLAEIELVRGRAMTALGRAGEAAAPIARALAFLEARHAPEHPDRLQATLYEVRRRHAAGAPWRAIFDAAAAEIRRVLPPGHVVRADLASLDRELGVTKPG